MAWCGRLFGVCAVLGAGVVVSGCLAQEPMPAGQLPVSRDTPFVLDIPENGGLRPTVRGQQPDPPSAPPRLPVTLTLGASPLTTPQQPQQPQPPAPLVQAPQQPQQQAPVVPTPGIQQVGFAAPNMAPPGVRVCAWVNGKPIFQDEVWNLLGGPQRFAAMPPADQEANVSKALENIIESELLMQDAMTALMKGNPKAVEHVKSMAAKEAQKLINSNMRDKKIDTIEEFKQLVEMSGTTLESVKHHMERDFIGNMYLRTMLQTKLDGVNLQDISDYYTVHINEFTQADRVKWQDIFIAVGPRHPTLTHAKQFAEQIQRSWAAGEKIANLIEFDDGQGATNKGAGVGEIKGDIRPRELEPLLFVMKDGDIGPVFEMSTGVHVFRLVSREYAGPMPFDDKIQTRIGNMLKNEILDRERRRIVEKLKERAIIQIDKTR